MNQQRMLSIMVLKGHIKERLIANHKVCLLNSPDTNKFLISSKIENGKLKIMDKKGGQNEGGYMHWDCVNYCWKRSGKITTAGGKKTTRGAAARNGEHFCAAKKAKSTASFYRCYPSRTVENSEDEIALGTFEDLIQYCSLGFTRESPGSQNLIKTENGLLLWTPEILERIKQVNFKGAITLEDKQYHMASYLIELFYDLAIGSANNILEAPGFEVPLGAWIKD